MEAVSVAGGIPLFLGDPSLLIPWLSLRSLDVSRLSFSKPLLQFHDSLHLFLESCSKTKCAREAQKDRHDHADSGRNQDHHHERTMKLPADELHCHFTRVLDGEDGNGCRKKQGAFQMKLFRWPLLVLLFPARSPLERFTCYRVGGSSGGSGEQEDGARGKATDRGNPVVSYEMAIAVRNGRNTPGFIWV